MSIRGFNYSVSGLYIAANLSLETCPIADYIADMKPAALRAEILSPGPIAVVLRSYPLPLLRFTFYVLRPSFSP